MSMNDPEHSRYGNAQDHEQPRLDRMRFVKTAEYGNVNLEFLTETDHSVIYKAPIRGGTFIFKQVPNAAAAVRQNGLQETASLAFQQHWSTVPAVIQDNLPVVRVPLCAGTHTLRDHEGRENCGYFMQYITPPDLDFSYHHLSNYYRHSDAEAHPLLPLLSRLDTEIYLRIHFHLRFANYGWAHQQRLLTKPEDDFIADLSFLRFVIWEGMYSKYAGAMGAALAMLQWQCCMDGAGVEFVLSKTREGISSLYLLDFGDCHRSEVIARIQQHKEVSYQEWRKCVLDELAPAFGQTPCWPKHPSQVTESLDEFWVQRYTAVWRAFTSAYRETAYWVLGSPDKKQFRAAADLFLDALDPANQLGEHANLFSNEHMASLGLA